MKIKSFIIDDEPLARKGLKEYISEVDFLEFAGEFESPLKAAGLLGGERNQLLFLDIQMPKITGLDFFRSLKDPPPVIFTTAYPQYALDGFDVNALDYLVKPISFDRFLKAVMKAKEYFETREKNASDRKEDFFFIKSGNKLVKLFFDEILFIEALQNYVTIYSTGKKFITYLTMKAVEEYLPSERFIKTHKSYIVSASKIDSIEGNIIHIANHQVPVSRSEKEDVMEKLLKGKFLKR